MLLMESFTACLQPSKAAAVCVLAHKAMLRLHAALASSAQVLAGASIRI